MKTRSLAVASLALLALPFAIAGQAAAQDVNFAGKQIRMIIGFGPSGGYDQHARLLIRHMNRHIPGNPSFVPQNMPGAGSLTAANTIYANSPKDGTVIGIIARDTPTQPLTGGTGAQFDATKFSWIGSPAAEVSVCMATEKGKVHTLEDLLSGSKGDHIIGGTGAGTGTEIYPKALNGLIGAHFKVVGGYPSSTDVQLAMERGEVFGICESWSSIYRKDAEAIKSGKYKVLFQASNKNHPDIPAPFLLDKVSADHRKELEFLSAGQTVGRPFIAPPDLQPGVLATLRKAFDATMKDKEYLADAAKQQMDIDPVSGAELEQLIKSVYATPKDIIKKVDDAIK
ncbi:MAG TPA: tripartite tricarboxylate transporter substrate-binding protein [Alphaproteobacteria bacterium]|nr:tripartite tricarboxylate transporter substrate-binding protein [Alphaproteobacteria bacterium]